MVATTISTLSYISLSGPMFSELGDGEIQTLETASTKGRALGQQDGFRDPRLFAHWPLLCRAATGR